MFLGSNNVAKSMELENKVECLIEEWSKNGSGDITDYLRKGFEQSESEDESSDSVAKTSDSSDDETTAMRTSKCRKKPIPTPLKTGRSTAGRKDDYSAALQEVANNEAILSSSMLSDAIPVSNVSQSDDTTNMLLSTINKRLGKQIDIKVESFFSGPHEGIIRMDVGRAPQARSCFCYLILYSNVFVISS